MTARLEPPCQYPLFRAKYLPTSAREGLGPPEIAEQASVGPRKLSGKALKVLDLRSLPRDDGGPPTELRARRDKLAFFDRHCTRVAEGLFVAGEAVAKSRELLREAGITHVVNCVGFLYPAYFKDELDYKVLYLQDTPGEDLLCVLYDIFDFIEGAAGGNVLVHCSQGVSRSTALAIAYLMHKTGRTYDEVFGQVKAHRGIANPNIGFICQLLQWYKRRNSSVERCRLYRSAPQSPSAGRYLVPKLVATPQPSSLDPRGAFVVQTPTTVYVWEGARCPEAFADAATRFAQQLVRYEGAEGPVVCVSQGREPPQLWECLGGVAAAEKAGVAPASPRENAVYDKDFELYQRAASSSSGESGGGDSARGGRKTPRDVGDQSTSPNERLRKQARNSGSGGESGSSSDEACARLEDLVTRELERAVSVDSAATQKKVHCFAAGSSRRLQKLQPLELPIASQPVWQQQ
ncbi:hypothetical protein N2152v2_010556 [Parachlorella kessleri]